MAKAVLTSWRGIHLQHRWEDLTLIANVMAAHRPQCVVELGTCEGGFAAFLADTVRPWGGRVVTYDIADMGAHEVLRRLAAVVPNVEVRVECDVLNDLHVFGEITNLLSEPHSMLYTDNGHKERELELYAPHLGPHALLGTHDYQDEVRPEWVEPYLAGHGYAPHRHDEFAALAHPEHYPVSMTRFWTRA